MADTPFHIQGLGYERVYLPLYKVADAPFHIQGDDFIRFETCLKTCTVFTTVYPINAQPTDLKVKLTIMYTI